jgi:hypothetical protein
MKHAKFIILFVAVIAVVLGFYYYLSNIKEKSMADDFVKVSRVREVLSRNLDARYPPTPKEVVRFFAEITQSLHNDDYTNHEFEDMGLQLYRLYDDELAENNPWESYLDDLRVDVNSYRNKDYVMTSYLVSNSTDVIYFSEEGSDYARMHCLFTLRRGTEFFSLDHQFLLRKGEQGRWKILGWQKEEPPNE